ncbi:MAG TPA: hypothetical protein PL048_21000 [Leptospiraceae bacterium]|nr:hypothetical protein [Leptospiraceae bacterium]HMZ61264.1 hypothetical protein [Leptospiraceae bacterium]HNF13289.1 hypothetical protein [Leptospiraceae bacterium]HNF25054.1 hypothetical protein [Leptospiraceae bacterium]HNI97235.1 hypothetical protein [Leptospiraceae bacterium]
MKRETSVFAAFLSLNGFLSINCLFYSYAKDSVRPAVIKEIAVEKKMNRIKSAAVLSSKGSERFIQFIFENNESDCLDLSSSKFQRSVSEFTACPLSGKTEDADIYEFPRRLYYFYGNRNLSDQEVYWNRAVPEALYIAAVRKEKVFFYEYSADTKFNLKLKEEFPSEGMDRRLKKEYSKVIVLNSVFDGALRIIVPAGAGLKHSYLMEWDQYSWKEKTEEASLIARIIVPAGGVLLDIITFPIQFVVGWTIALLYLSSKK